MTTEASPRPNPFPGLRPFTSDEDYLFFGRERQTSELLALLRLHRFIAVVGTSGSGKSSLVRAGLLPALLGGTMREAGAQWHVVLFRPGADPISSLARAMLDAGLHEQHDQESFFRLKATLTRSRNGLVEAVRQCSGALDGNLLVVVDQFEELFRFQRSAADAQESAVGFVKLLLAAIRQSESQIYVAITMRSDYLGDCAQIAGLAEAVNAGEYLIPRLTRDQRRAAIEGPVAVGRARITPRLVHRLLNDAGDDPDQLPVLQHALMRIWNCWCRVSAETDPLDLTHYEQIGGVQQALSLHADEVFFALPDDRHRVVAERVFKALTERGPDNRGIRRPMAFVRLCEVADASEQEMATVVNAFRKPGCTLVMPMTEVEITPRQVIDISHESLMRIWRRLDAWVEEEAQSARIYRRLAETARLHQLQEAGLYRDPDLQIALTWRQQAHPNEAWAQQYGGGFPQAVEFLEESRRSQQLEHDARERTRQHELEQARRLADSERLRADLQLRSARRLRILTGILAVAAAAALIAFAVAFLARQEARRNAVLAEQKAQEAQQQAEVADQSRQRSEANRQAAVEAQNQIGRELYTSAMNLAQLSFENGDHGGLVQSINQFLPKAGAPDLRGFEWCYWWYAAYRQKSFIRSPTSGPFFSLTASSDGRLLAASYWRPNVLVYDTHARQIVQILSRDFEATTNVGHVCCFSPDSTQFLVVGPDSVIRRWNTQNWTALPELRVDPSKQGADPAKFGLTAVAFSSAGDRVAVGDNTGGVEVRRADSWDVVQHLEGIRRVSSLAFSGDGAELYVGFVDSDQGDTVEMTERQTYPSMTVWDTTNWTKTRELDARQGNVPCIATSPKHDWTAWSTEDGSVQVCQRQFPDRVRRLAMDVLAYSLKFSFDGNYLAATRDSDNSVIVWRTGDWERVCTIKGHAKRVNGAVFGGEPSTLWSASADGMIKEWNVLDCEPSQRLAVDLPAIRHSMVLGNLSDGHTLLGFTKQMEGGSSLARWSLLDGSEAEAWAGGQKYLDAGVSSDGSKLVTCTPGHDIQVWEATSGDLLATKTTDALVAADMGVSGDGNTVVWMATEQEACVWNRLTQRETRLPCSNIWFVDFSLNQSGTRLTALNGGGVDIWDLTQEPPVRKQTKWLLAICAAMSPDGRTVAVGSWTNLLGLFDADSGRQLALLSGHAEAVQSVSFSPDGNRLVSTGNDKTFFLWDVEQRRPVSRFRGHDRNVNWAAFTPSGQSLVSVSQDEKVVRVWPAATAEQIEAESLQWIPTFEADEPPDKIAARLGEANRRAPRDYSLRLWRADLLMQLGRRREAVDEYIAALRVYPHDTATWDALETAATVQPVVDKGADGWRWTVQRPPDNWTQVDFDDASWQSGAMPCGPTDSKILWNTSDIWLRRDLPLERSPKLGLAFVANIDEKAEIYVNGVLAADAGWSAGSYVRVQCQSAASAAAHAGTNVLAVHASNVNGPQGIDLSVGVIVDADVPVAQALDELLKATPQDSFLLSRRAKRHLSRQEWGAAAQDYEQAAHQTRNDSFLWMYAATLFAKTRNVSAHEQLCRDMLETLPEGTDATYPERIGKICIFWQGSVVELERASAAILQAQKMIDADETLAWLKPWVQAALALARYRQGNLEETETLCRAVLSVENSETAWFGNLAHSLLSMALARQGQLAEAKAALAKSTEYLARVETLYVANPAADGWHDMIISQVLRAEAETVVGEAAAE